MIYVVLILSIIAIILSLFSLFAIWRLFKYIKYIIEDNQEVERERIDNIITTLKYLTKEGLIKDNGKFKKPYI